MESFSHCFLTQWSWSESEKRKPVNSDGDRESSKLISLGFINPLLVRPRFSEFTWTKIAIRRNYFRMHGPGSRRWALPNRGSFQDAEEGPGFAPTFVEKPRIIPNETGTLITMKCKCKANPKPDVTWFRGTNVVKESSKISIKTKTVEEDVYELIMEIKVNWISITKWI